MRARGNGDIRDVNYNSENWAVVKAALCAGMYPNIVKANKENGTLSSRCCGWGSIDGVVEVV